MRHGNSIVCCASDRVYVCVPNDVTVRGHGRLHILKKRRMQQIHQDITKRQAKENREQESVWIKRIITSDATRYWDLNCMRSASSSHSFIKAALKTAIPKPQTTKSAHASRWVLLTFLIFRVAYLVHTIHRLRRVFSLISTVQWKEQKRSRNWIAPFTASIQINSTQFASIWLWKCVVLWHFWFFEHEKRNYACIYMMP